MSFASKVDVGRTLVHHEQENKRIRERLSSTFTIIRCYDWSVYIIATMLVHIFVDGLRSQITNAIDCTVIGRTRSEMRDSTEILNRVVLYHRGDACQILSFEGDNRKHYNHQ